MPYYQVYYDENGINKYKTEDKVTAENRYYSIKNNAKVLLKNGKVISSLGPNQGIQKCKKAAIEDYKYHKKAHCHARCIVM